MIVQDTMQYLSQLDPEVGASVQEEFARQQRNIELIASENIVSPAVMVAMGTCLTNKYAEGYPGHRYYGGCFAVDVTEELARQRACQLFGCKYANVQPHSGANANLAAFFALAQPGDTILGMNLAHGGHLSHGSPVNISGKYFHIVPYGLGEDETIDYDALLETAKACKPKIIIAGASAYPRVIDFAKFREVADAVGAYLMVDMAHIAGLVAGASQGEGLGNQFLANIRETDAICEVVRFFSDPDVVHVAGKVDPQSDVETIKTELILADMATIEKAIPRLEKEAKRDKAGAAKLAAAKKVLEGLNEGHRARTLDLSEDEIDAIYELHLLTMKPMLYIANVAVGNDGGLTAEQIAAADVDGNGTVDSTDSFYIMYYVALHGAGIHQTWEEVLAK